MGLLSAIKNRKEEVKNSHGHTTLTTDALLGVDGDAVTPTNPGEFGIYRTAKPLKEPRSFTKAEANALGRYAAKRKIEAGATEEAMSHLRSIKSSDTKEQKAFNEYRAHEAQKTFHQVQSNAETGNQIASLASRYGALHQSVKHRLALETAKNEAIGNKVREFNQLW